MKIYIAGKISDDTVEKMEAHRQRFADKKVELCALGYNAVNPAENEKPPYNTWEYYLARDVGWLYNDNYDAIYLLEGWEESQGARLEHEVALRLGLKVIKESN